MSLLSTFLLYSISRTFSSFSTYMVRLILSRAIYINQCVHHTVVIICLTVTIYFSDHR